MTEKDFTPSGGEKLLRQFNPGRTPKEKRKSRKILFLLFLFSILIVGVATLSRELAGFSQNTNSSGPVISRKFVPESPTVTPTPPFTQEKQAIEEMIKPLRGKYAIYFLDLKSGQSFAINSQDKLTAASLIKLPVIVTLYQEAEAEKIDLDKVYKLQAEDKRGGAGSLQYKTAGFAITYRRMAELMGQQSDNTAFNIISQTLGGEKIQKVIDNLGMRETSFAENETSAGDIGLLLEKIYRGQVLNQESREEILSFLTKTIWEDRIPAGVPADIRVAHKIGTEVGVISDAGIIYGEKPFVLVIMSEGVNEIEAKKALPDITKKIWEMVE